jgi:hypothetical protein
VLAREQAVRLGLCADVLEEGLRDGVREQAVPVLGEGGGVPDGLIQGQAHEPAQQKVVTQLLAEAPLGGHGVEELHKLGAQEVLGGDRGTATGGVEGVEGGLHLRKGAVDEGSDGAQRVLVGHDLLEGGHEHQARLQLLVATHR